MKTIEEYVNDAIELLETYDVKEIRSTFFKHRLMIGDTKNNQLLEELELGGTISKPDKNGIRKVYIK